MFRDFFHALFLRIFSLQGLVVPIPWNFLKLIWQINVVHEKFEIVQGPSTPFFLPQQGNMVSTLRGSTGEVGWVSRQSGSLEMDGRLDRAWWQGAMRVWRRLFCGSWEFTPREKNEKLQLRGKNIQCSWVVCHIFLRGTI